MVTYVPGTEETDPKKQNMSLQQIGPKLDTAIANVATNTADIAALTLVVATKGSGTVTSVATAGLATGGPISSTGTVTVTAAVQSDQEAGSSNAVAVTPGRQHFHPSAAKAWVKFTGSGSNGAQTVNASYNVSGVSRTGTGAYTVSFTTAFSSADYAAIPSGNLAATSMAVQIAAASQAAGSIGIVFLNSTSAALVDPTNGYLVAFGDQ